MNRKIPYPPIFSSTPESTIDPETGASTWALGSQRCSPKMGSFTKNTINMNTHRNSVYLNIFIENILPDMVFLCSISMIKNGKEKIMV